MSTLLEERTCRERRFQFSYYMLVLVLTWITEKAYANNGMTTDGGLHPRMLAL